MAFTAEIPKSAPPNYLGYSGGGAGNQAGKYLGGIGEGLESAVKGIDQGIQDNIYKSLEAEASDIRDLFGASDMTKLAEATGVDGKTPPGLEPEKARLAKLQSAYESGALRDSHYWGKLNAAVKGMKDRFPGYHKEIDAMISGITGANPANRLVSELQQEAAAAKSDKDQEAVRFDSWLKQNQAEVERAQPGYFAMDPTKRMDQGHIMDSVSKIQAEDSRLKSKSLAMETKIKENTLQDTELENAGYEVANTRARQFVSGQMTSLGNTYQEVIKTISGIQNKGERASPEEMQQIGIQINDMTLQMQTALQQELSVGPYARLKKDKRDAIIATGMLPITSLAQSIYDEDFGMAKATAAIIEATKNEEVSKLLDKDIFRKLTGVKELLGPEAFAIWLGDSDNLSAVSKAFRLDKKGGIGLGNEDNPGAVIDDATKAGDASGDSSLPMGVIEDQQTVILGSPLVREGDFVDQGWKFITRGLPQFLAGSKEAQRGTLFLKLANPQMAAKAFADGQTSPKVWKSYQASVNASFGTNVSPLVSDLKQTPPEYLNLVDVVFNSETGQLEARAKPGAMLPGTMAGVEALPQAELIRKYQELNKYLAGLKSVFEADPGTKGRFAQEVEVMLKSLGVPFEVPDTGERRQGSQSGDNTLDNPSKQTADSSRNPNVLSFVDFVVGAEANGDWNAAYTDQGAASLSSLQEMTLDEVMGLQKKAVAAGNSSSAIGGPQFLRKTLRRLKTELGLNGDEFFDQELQQKLAHQLLLDRGLEDYLAGNLSKSAFMNNLAGEWAALPLASGKSRHAGVGNNAARVSRQELSDAVDKLSQEYTPEDPMAVQFTELEGMLAELEGFGG